MTQKKKPAEHHHAEHAEQAVRRKIIKGMAGSLPAVLTLGSGSAHAVASAFECAVDVNDGGRNFLTVDLTSAPTDAGFSPLEFPEVPLNINRKTGSTTTDRDANCVDTANPALSNDLGAAPGITDKNYYSSGIGSPVRLSGFGDIPNGSGGTLPDQACVVFVDANGQISYSYDENNNLPVTASCLVSVNPNL